MNRFLDTVVIRWNEISSRRDFVSDLYTLCFTPQYGLGNKKLSVTVGFSLKVHERIPARRRRQTPNVQQSSVCSQFIADGFFQVHAGDYGLGYTLVVGVDHVSRLINEKMRKFSVSEQSSHSQPFILYVVNTGRIGRVHKQGTPHTGNAAYELFRSPSFFCGACVNVRRENHSSTYF